MRHIYVLVRKDLSVPQQAVQGIHAAIEASRSGLIPQEIDHPHLVLCNCKGIEGLLNCARKLEKSGINYKLFYEPDIGDEPTALCTEPISGESRKLFKNYQLIKEANNVVSA